MSTQVSTQENVLSLATLTQNDIPALLAQVTQKIKAIKGDMADKPLTTGELKGFGKIANIKTVSDLIKAHSSVVARETAYNISAEAILPEGIKKPAFILDGSSAKAWVNDIEKRVIEVARASELKKLNTVKTTLEANLSAEAKMANDLKKLQSILAE